VTDLWVPDAPIAPPPEDAPLWLPGMPPPPDLPVPEDELPGRAFDIDEIRWLELERGRSFLEEVGISPIGGGALVFPAFQPQNPDINGYYLGWASCTAYAGAMAAAFDRQVQIVMTGAALRNRTGDTSGGLTLAQIDAALNTYWHINLTTYYRLPFTSYQKMTNGGAGSVLQGLYAPIADSRYDAGRGFRDNHAIANVPTWAALDPLADGRYGEAYRYRGEPYLPSLLQRFAGKLDLDPRGAYYRPLGDGLVYAAFTRDRTFAYSLVFSPGDFWAYDLGHDGRIASRESLRFSGATSVSCRVPRRIDWPGHGSRLVAQVTNGRSSLYGKWIGVPQYHVKLRVAA